MAKTEFEEFIENDIKNQQGISHPVKASMLECLLVKKTPCTNLHPNENDEFSVSEIGPSYKIISEYESKFRQNLKFRLPVYMDPLTVEKIRPRGYLILNGHHRWAAAMRAGLKKVPIKIVNLAQESDIKKILEKSKHDKRGTLDLDEVVFRPGDYPYLEKMPRTLLNFKFKNRLRLGIPALFYFLSKNGYDIWVYSANYYSIDDIKKFFRCYSVNVDGIITGTARKKQSASSRTASMEQMIANKYSETLHIDNDMILLTRKNSGSFEEYEIKSEPAEWSKTAMSIIGEIEKHEKETEAE